jgi:glucose-6-phosphate 1-dehydrogenase
MDGKKLEVLEKGITRSEPPNSCVICIFGASGDLSHRELIPSLFSLFKINLLPRDFAIVGYSSSQYTDESFREDMYDTIMRDTEYNEDSWKRFSKNLFFVNGDFNDTPGKGYKKLHDKIEKLKKDLKIADNILFHLATPSEFYGTIVKRLEAAKLTQSETGWRRVIIEKPFGSDRQSSIELDEVIKKVLREDQIFRVDHFLGKETVQNMLVFRFANPGFEPIWNRDFIDNVQITVSEDIGIGRRGSFYEETGIVRDMVQNHLLQLLCMIAIEPPVNYDAKSLRTETSKVLDSVCKIDVENNVVLGQYDSGIINSEVVKGYREEFKVSKNSMVPTYAAMKLYLDNWRWAGVPFFLRTGKRLTQRLAEITIDFKPTPHLMFHVKENEEKEHNFLTFRLQPNEGIVYTFTAKQPGSELKLRPVHLDFEYASAFGISEPPSAYQWLLYDAMRGDQTLFPKSEWIYDAWSIVDPIIKKWEDKPWSKFPNYKAGTWGPKEADVLVKKSNCQWHVT